MPYYWKRRIVRRWCTRIKRGPHAPGEWEYFVDEREIRRKVWREDSFSAFLEVTEMKKRARSDQRAKGEYAQHTEEFFKRYPEICRVLWDCWFEDGSARELGKLSIGLVPDGVNLALTDPSERVSAFCTAQTLKDAMRLLEDAIAGPGDPWRPWPKSFGKK